jgi:hypothetical protein
MTGRDLIVYILQNNLENEPVFKDGKFIGFMTEGEAAEKFDVGVATIRLWFEFGWLNGIKLYDETYILRNAEIKEPD